MAVGGLTMASFPDEEEEGGSLSLRHGFRCVPEAGSTVEDVLEAVGEKVGYEVIASASRMNKAVVVFLSDEKLINGLVESGLWVNEVYVPITPLFSPTVKVTVSNVPPFIRNNDLLRELARFGKIASAMKTIPLGCRRKTLRHVKSFRRQIFMILDSPTQTLDVSFRVKDGTRWYMVYATTGSLRCFECGDIGHKRHACPHKQAEQRAEAGTSTGSRRGSASGRRSRSPTVRTRPQGAAPGNSNGSSANNETSQVSGILVVENTVDNEEVIGGELQEPRGLQTEQLSEVLQQAPLLECTASPVPPECAQLAPRKEGGGESEVVLSEAPAETPVLSGEAAVEHSNDGCELVAGATEENEAGPHVVPVEALGGSGDAAVEMCEVDIRDGEDNMSEVSSVSDVGSQVSEGVLYTLEEINVFLDETFGKSVSVAEYFPDVDKFVSSVGILQRTHNYVELSKQKRFRLKKLVANIRKGRLATSRK